MVIFPKRQPKRQAASLKARSHGAIFLFATAMQKMDCVDVNEGVHMVRFHVPAMHWCV